VVSTLTSSCHDANSDAAMECLQSAAGNTPDASSMFVMQLVFCPDTRISDDIQD